MQERQGWACATSLAWLHLELVSHATHIFNRTPILQLNSISSARILLTAEFIFILRRVLAIPGTVFSATGVLSFSASTAWRNAWNNETILSPNSSDDTTRARVPSFSRVTSSQRLHLSAFWSQRRCARVQNEGLKLAHSLRLRRLRSFPSSHRFKGHGRGSQ